MSFERWPKKPPSSRKSPWDVVPDLAIEVVSENDTAYDLVARIGEFFRAGVRRVWVVFPDESLVYDYESPTRSVRILQRGDELDGEPLLPGFRLAAGDTLRRRHYARGRLTRALALDRRGS